MPNKKKSFDVQLPTNAQRYDGVGRKYVTCLAQCYSIHRLMNVNGAATQQEKANSQSPSQALRRPGTGTVVPRTSLPNRERNAK